MAIILPRLSVQEAGEVASDFQLVQLLTALIFSGLACVLPERFPTQNCPFTEEVRLLAIGGELKKLAWKLFFRSPKILACRADLTFGSSSAGIY